MKISQFNKIDRSGCIFTLSIDNDLKSNNQPTPNFFKRATALAQQLPKWKLSNRKKLSSTHRPTCFSRTPRPWHRPPGRRAPCRRSSPRGTRTARGRVLASITTTAWLSHSWPPDREDEDESKVFVVDGVITVMTRTFGVGGRTGATPRSIRCSRNESASAAPPQRETVTRRSIWRL